MANYDLIGGAPGEPGSVPVIDNGHMHEGPAVKVLGDTSRYPDTEEGLKAQMRSEMDNIMGDAHFSLLDLIKSLFRLAIDALKEGVGAIGGFIIDIVTNVVEFGMKLIGTFIAVFDSLAWGKPPPPSVPPEYYTAIATDLEGAIGGFLKKAEYETERASDLLAASSAARAELNAALDPEHPDFKLWAMQEQVDQAQDEAAAAMLAATQANTSAINTLQEYVVRTMCIQKGVNVTGDHFAATWSSSKLTLTRRGDWAGTAIIQYLQSEYTDSSYAGDYTTNHSHKYARTRMWETPVPAANGSTTFTVTPYEGEVLVHYTVNRGKATSFNTKPGTLRDVNPSNSQSYIKIAEWTVPKKARVAASGKAQWANKTRLGSYRMELRLNGTQNITSAYSSKSAPLFGHGPRDASVVAPHQMMEKGDVVSLWAYANHSNSLNRQIRDDALYVTWIDATGDITKDDAV